MSNIKIEKVSKRYNPNDLPAVNDVSFEVKPGEIFGFLGPNGAGKTTLIKMMTGLLRPDAGAITMGGKDIVKTPEEAKKMFGYVPDTPSLFGKIRGIDYLNFIANIYEVSKEDREARIKEYSEALALTDALYDLVESYSHGMKQKLAVIGVLVYEPKVWILDEPLVGLDPKSAFTLKELMKKHAEKGNIVFFSSHILEVVEKLCDRIGIIRKGEIVTIGSIKEIKEAFKDESLEDIVLEIIDNE